jgi:hypothetical protein
MPVVDQDTGEIDLTSPLVQYFLQSVRPEERYAIRGPDGGVVSEEGIFPAGVKKVMLRLRPVDYLMEDATLHNEFCTPTLLREGEAFHAPNGQVLRWEDD